MQFNPVMLHALLQKNDAELWATIRALAEKNGMKLSDATPSKSEMEKLRGVLSGAEKMDPREAKRLLDNMKKGGK